MKNRLLKSRVLLIITTMEKIQEGEKTSFRVVKKNYESVSGRELQESYEQDLNKGLKREIVEVYEAPREFVFGVLYVLVGGKRAWIFREA